MTEEQKKAIKTEQKIGSTTYIVTSHFPAEGSTAVDKIKRLIDVDTKAAKYGRKS